MIDWTDVLTILNVLLAGLGAGLSFYYVYHYRRPFSWLKLAYGVVGLYWCGLYLYVMVTDFMGITRLFGTAFGEIFVRPAFTFTLALMASGAIWRIRSGRP